MKQLKETEKALLMEKNAVPFWIKRQWLKADGSLSAAGVKAYAIAAREHWKHWDFDAIKTFALVRETEKAVLLRCEVELPHENRTAPAEFWVPRSLTCDYKFVCRKAKEVLERFPFVGAKVRGLA
ncbi:MAG: hypothetical protein LBF78_07495 [Treponema sp.]|jgi:hypothetical protein|nr:hypothetical protein [Treponema sp.]